MVCVVVGLDVKIQKICLAQTHSEASRRRRMSQYFYHSVDDAHDAVRKKRENEINLTSML
jgi:hypothetical protein